MITTAPGLDEPHRPMRAQRGKHRQPARGARKVVAYLPRLAVVGAAAGLLSATHVASAAAVPATPIGLPAKVDPLAAYNGATTCSQTVKPGTAALMKLLVNSYPGSRSLGMLRECGSGRRSEHKEGRALDWGNRAWVASEAANVHSFTTWALKTDSHGNDYAMARRLGIMYMIWNDKIWESNRAGQGWQPYLHASCSSIATCNSTLRHRDHLHISLSWDGAMGRTSFWSGRVNEGDYAASRKFQRSPVSLTKTTLSQGSSGPEVLRLQKALRMAQATGYFGSITKRSVLSYQRSRGLSVDGVVGRQTWKRLQRELASDAKKVRTVEHTVLRVGATNKAVKVMESALNLRVDGYFSWADRAAVQRFQAQQGVPSTGVVARLTWGAMKSGI